MGCVSGEDSTPGCGPHSKSISLGTPCENSHLSKLLAKKIFLKDRKKNQHSCSEMGQRASSEAPLASRRPVRAEALVPGQEAPAGSFQDGCFHSKLSKNLCSRKHRSVTHTVRRRIFDANVQ